MEAKRTLKLGLREEDRPTRFQYDNLLFAPNGRYADAIRKLSPLFGGRTFEQYHESERQLVLQMVHQCEEARRWRALEEDYPRALSEYYEKIAEDFNSAAELVSRLRKIERKHPYFFRHIVGDAMERVAPESGALDVIVPDPNHPDGGTRYVCDAKTRRFIEHQFSLKILMFQLDDFLTHIEKGLRDGGRRRAINQIGCMKFDPPLTRTSATKIRADVTGLCGWLAYHLREWTAGRGAHPYWPGAEMPRDGRPNWDIVAEFVNAALPSEKIHTPTDLRKRWSSLSQKKTVRLYAWPRGPLREPQAQ